MDRATWAIWTARTRYSLSMLSFRSESLSHSQYATLCDSCAAVAKWNEEAYGQGLGL